jgi:hypothetical protein
MIPPWILGAGGHRLRFLEQLRCGDDSRIGAACRIAQMKTTCTHHSVFLLCFLLQIVATVTGAQELTGTRPGVEGEALTIEGTLFLLDVSKVDGADQSFTADVFMMLRWRDERLASEVEGLRRLPIGSIWNPRVQIINQRRIWKTFPESVDVAPDGTVVYRQRYYGQFASALDLRDFPLDRHRFAVQLVVPGYGPEEIEFVPSNEEFGIGRSPEMTVPDWSIGPFALQTAPYAVIPGGREIAGLEGNFVARRHLGFYIGKAFVSVAIIVFMSWVVFWLAPEHVGPRLSVAVTSMLTLVAYRFLLGQSLPPVSYLTRLDYFLLGATILVFVALIQVAATSALNSGDHPERAIAINRFSRWVFPVAFLFLIIWAFSLL